MEDQLRGKRVVPTQQTRNPDISTENQPEGAAEGGAGTPASEKGSSVSADTETIGATTDRIATIGRTTILWPADKHGRRGQAEKRHD
jgi:hypothetical protein